jgi:hypothetical protein
VSLSVRRCSSLTRWGCRGRRCCRWCSLILTRACRRASYGAGLAHALLTQGASDDAVAAATGVLATIEAGMTSMRCLTRLRLVRNAAGTTPSAQQFRDRFDAISHALAAYDQPCDDPPRTTTSIPAPAQP